MLIYAMGDVIHRSNRTNKLRLTAMCHEQAVRDQEPHVQQDARAKPPHWPSLSGVRASGCSCVSVYTR